MAFNSITLLVIFMTLCGFSHGVVYNVGDSDGWTYLPRVVYKEWASAKSFHVGDVVVFEYQKEFHNVLEVRHHDFRTCNITSPVMTYSSGKDYIALKMPGHYFYTCGFPGHCQAGQKVDLRVLPSVGSQSPNTTSPPLAGLDQPPSPRKSAAGFFSNSRALAIVCFGALAVLLRLREQYF